ncbi:MAG: hypothetical protein KDC34_19040 [Saprospiraceae bacterium]|nr:hypothetical protein [Saprospiraceae bacterium]
MKPLFLSILLLCCLSVYQADGQQPFYDAELTQVCMDSAGVKTNLYGLNLYVFGRNSVLPRFFFDSNGNKVVPGGGVTLYDVPCQYLITEREADAISTESSFPPGFGYTIPADTYSSVTVTNIGIINHQITVDGSTIRLVPGEIYYFYSQLDPVTNEWTTNPEIIITDTGVIGDTNLRLYMQPK